MIGFVWTEMNIAYCKKCSGQLGISFFKEGVWGSFSKVILMSRMEVQIVFLMINFDVWDRLGYD